MIRLSLRSNQFMFTICRKYKSKECKMSDNFAWVCMCILEGGHFSFLGASWREATFHSWMQMQIHDQLGLL